MWKRRKFVWFILHWAPLSTSCEQHTKKVNSFIGAHIFFRLYRSRKSVKRKLSHFLEASRVPFSSHSASFHQYCCCCNTQERIWTVNTTHRFEAREKEHWKSGGKNPSQSILIPFHRVFCAQLSLFSSPHKNGAHIFWVVLIIWCIFCVSFEEAQGCRFFIRKKKKRFKVYFFSSISRRLIGIP